MAEHNEQQLDFREWTAHYEKEQEAHITRFTQQDVKIDRLVETVSSLTSKVEILVDNQKGMFSRMNRPWQWGVVVAVFMGVFSMAGMFGTILTLSLNPVKDAIKEIQNELALESERNLSLHIWFRDSISKLEVQTAKSEIDREWIRKMEERVNRRTHAGIGE